MGRRNKEYYAVIDGRVDRPTIFSSWGDAHPRVTGCTATHSAFETIKEARDYMAKKGVSEYDEVIKSTALGTTPERGHIVYHAVAYGANPGIRENWYGEKGALKEVHEIPGACYKRFRTEAQAKAFIEDWIESFADVCRRVVKEKSKGGVRPQGMTLSVEGLLHKRHAEPVEEDIVKQFGTKLRLDETEGIGKDTPGLFLPHY